MIDENPFLPTARRSPPTVLLSWSALTQFAPFHWSSAELATYVAEWALLTGCVEGTIELYPDTAVLADCMSICGIIP